jgi:radical SAM superfamily enzyme YgiQ (UPF0313 family)
LSFPDLYEVGMSNTAVKLLYGMLNAMSGVACERVFVPAPDFENALKDAGIPLYTLETGMLVRDTHLLAISYGYELLATNVLTLLKSSGISVFRNERAETDPVVIMGGPGATNPRPMSPFVDGIFCGEAEAALPELVEQMERARSAGASRTDYLMILRDSPHVWTHDRARPARRAIWEGFGRGASPAHVPKVDGIPAAFGAGFPVPHIPVVQDHGPIEIMRGCPQGCRFCHAGVYYRPYRMKPISEIVTELEWLVERQGYRDITFSSLSSGDYGELVPLLNRVNEIYLGRGVSFQLPSLRINSVTLPIFEQLSRGRRSGLTFAVEAARTEDQRAMNKMVPVERTIEIAREAFLRGWKQAKLYFMIGLPLEDSEGEARAIVDYVRQLRRAVKMEFVVNVGTFVPKPHTPFQWEAQLSPDAAKERIAEIRGNLPKGTRLRAADPWMSWLEGVLSRGSEQTGYAIARAHELGARLDAWGEYLRRDIWEVAFDEMPEATSGANAFSHEDSLPWDGIDLGVSEPVLLRERQRASESVITEQCSPECGQPCGVCNKRIRADGVVGPRPEDQDSSSTEEGDRQAEGTLRATREESRAQQMHGNQYYLVVRYRKCGPAAFIPHLGLVSTFERAWQRLGIPLALTEGFHPKARMSFGQPLPLGVESDDELMVVSVQKMIHLENDYLTYSAVMPAGLEIISAVSVCHVPQTPKLAAPMQRYGGSIYSAETVAGQDAGDKSAEILSGVITGTPGATLDHACENSARFTLGADSPGLGRIIKDNDLRGLIRFRRIRMLGTDGNALYSYYTSRAQTG